MTAVQERAFRPESMTRRKSLDALRGPLLVLSVALISSTVMSAARLFTKNLLVQP